MAKYLPTPGVLQGQAQKKVRMQLSLPFFLSFTLSSWVLLPRVLVDPHPRFSPSPPVLQFFGNVFLNSHWFDLTRVVFHTHTHPQVTDTLDVSGQFQLMPVEMPHLTGAGQVGFNHKV